MIILNNLSFPDLSGSHSTINLLQKVWFAMIVDHLGRFIIQCLTGHFMVQNRKVVHQPEKPHQTAELKASTSGDWRIWQMIAYRQYSQNNLWMITCQSFSLVWTISWPCSSCQLGWCKPYQRWWTRGHVIVQNLSHWPAYPSKAEQLRDLTVLAMGFRGRTLDKICLKG